MKVATYSRVSTNDKGQNPLIQAEELRRFCGARGWSINLEVIESMSGATDRRPGFQKVMDAVRSRQVDAVIVTKMDRLFRSLRHLVSALDEFQALGVQFVSIGDQIDMTTASGRLMLHIVAAFAEFERGLIRERTMAGLEYARSQGTRLGRPEHPMRSQIIELAGRGMSYRQIRQATGASLGTISAVIKGVQKSGVKSGG